MIQGSVARSTQPSIYQSKFSGALQARNFHSGWIVICRSLITVFCFPCRYRM